MAARSTAAGIASLQTRAGIVRLALWGFIAVTVVALVIQLAVVAREAQMADPPLFVYAASALVSVAFWLTLVLAAIPICAWIHRAHANLSEAGVTGLTHSAAWAVGSYFVPVANLLVPFQAMRELHNRSSGEPEEFATSSVDAVTSWWACHVAAVLVTTVLGFMALLPLLTNIWFTTPPAATSALGLFAYLLWFGSAWYLLRTVREVTEAQQHGVATVQVFE